MNNLKRVHKFKNDNKFIEIKSIPVQHGKIDCISYIVNKKLAYASDVSKIYKKDIFNFKKLKYLIVDCLRYDPHYSHFNLEKVLKLVDFVKPKKTILTNLNNEMDYSELKRKLPKNIVPAYDGMSFLI